MKSGCATGSWVRRGGRGTETGWYDPASMQTSTSTSTALQQYATFPFDADETYQVHL